MAHVVCPAHSAGIRYLAWSRRAARCGSGRRPEAMTDVRIARHRTASRHHERKKIRPTIRSGRSVWHVSRGQMHEVWAVRDGPCGIINRHVSSSLYQGLRSERTQRGMPCPCRSVRLMRPLSSAASPPLARLRHCFMFCIPHYMAFFISRSWFMTLMGSFSPVALLSVSYRRVWQAHISSGRSRRMKTFHSFSSPMVDLPVVQLSFCAVASSLVSASDHRLGS